MGLTIEQWAALYREASPRPWRHEASKTFSGDDWLLASMGNGHDGLDHYVCTDHIHCSEMRSGGASEDADLIVAMRNHGPEVFGELIAARRLVSILRENIDGLIESDGGRGRTVKAALDDYDMNAPHPTRSGR
ncbi:MAG: hypothetical protein WC683_09550 [bacterium]|jgi:hypothetical protein